jgi:hypothetical protein
MDSVESTESGSNCNREAGSCQLLLVDVALRPLLQTAALPLGHNKMPLTTHCGSLKVDRWYWRLEDAAGVVMMNV